MRNKISNRPIVPNEIEERQMHDRVWRSFCVAEARPAIDAPIFDKKVVDRFPIYAIIKVQATGIIAKKETGGESDGQGITAFRFVFFETLF